MPRSDVPAHWPGYDPDVPPKDRLDEQIREAVFRIITNGDDLEPLPEDGVSPEVA